MRDRWEQDDVVGRRLRRAAADLGRDPEVGVDGQMGPVILEGGDGDETDALFRRRPANLRPGEALVEERPTPHRPVLTRY